MIIRLSKFFTRRSATKKFKKIEEKEIEWLVKGGTEGRRGGIITHLKFCWV